ncbi:hypothetical protein HN014_04085 [Aquimarina sp. TRL1]|uniref:hypothetical protein n=1 Tax=Aquimarina sp. (strain TRL1) TaxID=2736252 RepID=UPI00158945AD|nr:hypothetical protein [Aquimarina sp. TRL1]QKX04119.1 hypothetical protein HN014_04085 [Aquimarina sp. TRL1]
MKKNKNISYGNNSTNIGSAKKVVINYDSQKNVDINDYEKKSIADFKVKPKKLSLYGAIGSGATFLAYLGVFVKFPILEIPQLITYLPLVFFLFFLFFVIGVILKNRKFIPLIRNYTIESDDLNISLKKTKIHCPKCQSKMRIFQDNSGVFISCNRNPEQHIYFYDYTTFTDTE